MTPTCTPAPLAYNAQRGVETTDSGTPHPSDLRFFCAPCLDSLYGLEGRGIPNTRRRLSRFRTSKPPFTGQPALPSKHDRSASHGQ